MPKNLKVLLLVVLAVNAMNDIEADFVHGELQLSPKTSYRLQKEGVLRIEKQQKGSRLTAVLVTKDKSSTLNGLRFNILEKSSQANDFYQQFTKQETPYEHASQKAVDHYQAHTLIAPSLELLQSVQLILYDDEPAQQITICA
ncbi:hypothetical protein PQO01_20815 [Lentisphaera marina]|uniref:hypothetical protein n=1 Tax=Lentisphaera marina TaxID=1111041 RepID=UPI0023654308|nr:hypothetical protein [Lentisphaera marina]MDD7985466.1 hypothetical protein [Lentisphaera marina]MDD7987401.1 hypothetical protein [Lentisphaera marina]